MCGHLSVAPALRRLEPRQLLRRRVLQHLGEIFLRRRVFRHALLLRDKVPVSPVNLRRLQLCAGEQTLVAIIELRRQYGPAPTVEHRVMEAENELEALLRATEYVDMEQRPILPVEDMAFTSFRPFCQVNFLLSEGEAAQVFDLQRQPDAPVHDLQRALTLKHKAGAQDGMLFDT